MMILPPISCLPVSHLLPLGHLPFFSKCVWGDASSSSHGGIAKMFTPQDGHGHWVDTKCSVVVWDWGGGVAWRLDGLPRLEPTSLALEEGGTRFAACLRGEGLAVWGPRGELGRAAVAMPSGVSWSPCGSLIALGASSQEGGALHIVAVGVDGSLGPVLPLPRAKCMSGLHDCSFQSAWSRDSSHVCFTSSSWGSMAVAVFRVTLTGAFEEAWSATWSADEDEGETLEDRGPPFPIFTGCVVAVGAIGGKVMAFRYGSGERLPDLMLSGVPKENRLSHFAADRDGRHLWFTVAIETGSEEPMVVVRCLEVPPEWVG